MGRDLRDFSRLSSGSSIETFFITCLCQRRIYLPRKAQKQKIKCYRCGGVWKVNYPMQMVFGTGENKGVHLRFERKT
jgi:hypothetical protein